MLPHLARITLDEHASNIIRRQLRWFCGGKAFLWFHAYATEGVATRGGQTRVILLPTETPGNFLLFILFRILVIVFARSPVIVTASALALARVWEVGS
jgi:hypothetical protein